MNSKIMLIDRWGNEQILEQMGNYNRTKHSRVLSVLEKRALRYRNRVSAKGNDNLSNDKFNTIDETGTVDRL
jgi:hypothetical protein